MPQRSVALKYGAPLYCACWPFGELVFVGGGGGKKSSGIPNKVICIPYTADALAAPGQADAEQHELRLGDTPLRLVGSKDGKNLLVALGGGGLQCLDLSPENGAGLRAAQSQGALAERVSSLRSSHYKCLAFNAPGTLLALGAEDGSLQVLEWPSLAIKFDNRGDKGLKDALRDLDFSRAHKDRVLVSACEDGSCSLWETETGDCLTTLELPAGFARAGFNRAKFARGGALQLFTIVNKAGEGHVLLWEQAAHGEMAFRRAARAHTSPVTSFDISPDGAYLGTGSSEGEVAVLSSSKLTPLRQVKAGHMVFVTAVAFAPNSAALLSVSADASARVTSVKAANSLTSFKPGGLASKLLLLLTLVVALLAVAVQMLRSAGVYGSHSPRPPDEL